MDASPKRRHSIGTIQEKTIYEASEFLAERLGKLTDYWTNLKANYVNFSSSIRLAYPLTRSSRGLHVNITDGASLDLPDVERCYDAMKETQFTESAVVIGNFLHMVKEIEKLHQEIEIYRPTLVANQDSKKARYVREFCVEFEKWRKMLENKEDAKTVHPEVLSLTSDKDIQRRTGRVFSIIPVMLDHANSVIKIMKKGWPPRLDTVLQRPRTACMLTSPRLRRSASVTSLQPLFLGNSAKTVWRPQDAVVTGQTTNSLRKSNSALGLPSLENDAVDGSRRLGVGGSFSDIDDEAPLSRCSSPSQSSSSAYESLSRVTITNSNVTISSGSDAESSQWSPDSYKRHGPIVREITEALQSKFDEELGKVTTRLEKKITDATDSLRDDIQNDLQKRDKRIDKIKSDVDQLSKFVDEKFSNLDIEILRTDVLLREYIKPLDDEQIHVIGQNIGPRVYPKMARELGISRTQLEWIKEKWKDDEQEVVIAVLHEWRKATDKRRATIETIIRALVNINERSTANQILRAFKEE